MGALYKESPIAAYIGFAIGAYLLADWGVNAAQLGAGSSFAFYNGSTLGVIFPDIAGAIAPFTASLGIWAWAILVGLGAFLSAAPFWWKSLSAWMDQRA